MKENNSNSPLGTGDIEERLWSFIDGNISAGERSVIEKLVASDAAWKAKYHELLEVNELISSSELEAPSLRFTKNVMEEIGRLHVAPATKSYINKRIIWGIGFFFIALFTGFLIYGFAQMGLTTGEETKISKDIGKLDFSKFFNNTWVNVFMMINVVLGLFLLDNYLTTKKKEFRSIRKL